MPFSVDEAHSLFEQLPDFAAMRLSEISGMASPYIEITDRYARLVARLTYLLGHNAPTDDQDRVIRDLMADAFDFLYEARILIVGGKLAVAYPLARRAYESLSLLHLCSLEPKWAAKWEKGIQVGNSEIRKALGAHEMGEPEAEMKNLYSFFSEAAHPNRSLVSHRFLGDGNAFVLGLIGKPELCFVVDYCAKHLELWHWLAAVLTYFYREKIRCVDPKFFQEWSDCHTQALPVKQWLHENFASLRQESLAILEQERSERGKKLT